MKSHQIFELTESQRRQAIDSEMVFRAWLAAKTEAREVRGGMVWRAMGKTRYLIRTSTKGAQKSLGPESDETKAIYERFHDRKTAANARLAALATSLHEQERLNKALSVGHMPNIVTKTISALANAGLGGHFVVVGTHSLYAYESHCGARFSPSAMATRDIDLLFDSRKRIAFVEQLRHEKSSLIGALQKADPSFRVRPDQLQTAVNDAGFEVDVIRRNARDGDPHPMRMSDSEDDFWAVQVESGNKILSNPLFSQVVASQNGQMAMVRTVDPETFVQVKLWLADKPDRDPRKVSKDRLQASLVQDLIEQYMPQRAAKLSDPASAPPRP